MEDKLITRYKLITIAASFVFCIFMVAIIIEEYYYQEWDFHQSKFKEILISKAQNSIERRIANNFTPKVEQITLNKLNRTDRCISCHTGIQIPELSKEKNPYKAHSGSYLTDHPVDQYGCTICHNGQGNALNIKEAHAIDEEVDWAYPLLSSGHLSSRCGRCHLTVFDESKMLKDLDLMRKGLELFKTMGCLGCHKTRSVGGTTGPDLTDQGNKTKKQYYFEFIEGEHSIHNWMKEHFADPGKISPGSKMIRFNFDDQQKDALITFLLGLFKPDLPINYYPIDVLEEFKGHRKRLIGEAGFQMVCSACHGSEGLGRDYKKDIFGVPTISNPDFQAVASLDFLDFTIRKGRGMRLMPFWTPRFSGLDSSEIKIIIHFVRSFRKEAPSFLEISRACGSRVKGMQLYESSCRTCHGKNGEGDLAPSLNTQNFLTLASDKFIYENLVTGRSNTAMPSWSRLSANNLADLISYLRSWQKRPIHRSRIPQKTGDVDNGTSLYHYYCSRCHGRDGYGGIGPVILNPDFLSAASDQFLASTIAYGHEKTPMYGWYKDLGKGEKITQQEIWDIVSYLKKSENRDINFIDPGPNLGDANQGTMLFEKYCSECHGKNGEGIEAPALNNDEFLNAATNGYLLATITLGREGTPMPSWGKGSEKYKLLNTKEKRDIVAFVRQWQKFVIKKK